jgi:phage repressor protein C with HTH and peptisase S24 domain
VQSANPIIPSQIPNSPSKITDDNNGGSDELIRNAKLHSGSSSWHQNNSSSSSSNISGSQKMGMSNFSNTLPNTEALNDNNDSTKTNYSAMTKKRKAMHQANSSNRNSADENVNK